MEHKFVGMGEQGIKAFRMLVNDNGAKQLSRLKELLDEALCSNFVKHNREKKRSQVRMLQKEKVAKVSLKSKSAIMKQHKGHRKQKAHMAVSPQGTSDNETDPDGETPSNQGKRCSDIDDDYAALTSQNKLANLS